MSWLGNIVKVVTRGGQAKAFGFIADLAWEMLRAEKGKGTGNEKLDTVLAWFARVFSDTFGAKYEALRAAVVELIAAVKKVVNLIQELT